ncbi:hypothetical protein [Flavobacterium hercynium]|uniref:Uncharacterized protein n=1 Tax=Flavobacterium hercynium TaxID=387094 RepID=A0A226H0P2_9FLAO|nr:hypothetical protein [Flavobacterium hercynium]OXA87408.1 hypothetical protein B0A66_16595 [Flavobacterium hercynium]
MNPKNGYDERTVINITTTTSTLIVYLSLLTILLFVDFYYFKILDLINQNSISVILNMFIIGIINYVYFIKDKKFLEKGFKTDKKGGYVIILFIVLNSMCLLYFANKNREKIFAEREKARIEKNR